MPRPPRIRITSKDREELRKLNKNVLNKKSRIRLKYGLELDNIQTKSITDFKTRDEFNRYKEQMRSFTNRANQDYQYVKNKHGVVITKREMNEVEREIRRINRIKTQERKRIEKLPFTDRGKPTGLTVGQQADPVHGMKDPRYGDLNNLRFNPDRFRNKAEFEEYKAKLFQNYKGDFLARKNKLYKQNYLQALLNVFSQDPNASYEGLPSNGKQIYDHIKNMSDKEFIDMYYSKNLAEIGFIYDPLEQQAKLEQIKGVYGIE